MNDADKEGALAELRAALAEKDAELARSRQEASDLGRLLELDHAKLLAANSAIHEKDAALRVLVVRLEYELDDFPRDARLAQRAIEQGRRALSGEP